MNGAFRKSWFTLAESLVSVLILGLVLYWAVNSYFGFEKNSESVKTKVRAENYARYLQELVDSSPPGTGSVMPNAPFYLAIDSEWRVSYTQDPSRRTSDTGFLPGLKAGTLSHEITLAWTWGVYGKTFYNYRITATYNDATRTVYLTK